MVTGLKRPGSLVCLSFPGSCAKIHSNVYLRICVTAECPSLEEQDSFQALLEKMPNTVPFLGAGFSVPDCLSWWGFLDKFKEEITRDYLLDDDLEKLETLAKANNVEAYADFLIKAADRGKTNALLEKYFGNRQVSNGLRPRYDALHRAFEGLKITTNFDCLIENTAPIALYPIHGNQPESLEKALTRDLSNGLLKIHGGIDDPDSIILTQAQYEKAYGHKTGFREDQPLPKFLARVFRNKSLLFMGCSLAIDRTMAVLEGCGVASTHFALMRFPNNKEKRVALSRRLSQFQIRVIWIKDYAQITSVLKKLAPIEPDSGTPSGEVGDSTMGSMLSDLPYMCDRSRQKEQFLSHYARMSEDLKNRPRVFVVHGHDGEAHGSFVDTLFVNPTLKDAGIGKVRKLKSIHDLSLNKQSTDALQESFMEAFKNRLIFRSEKIRSEMPNKTSLHKRSKEEEHDLKKKKLLDGLHPDCVTRLQIIYELDAHANAKKEQELLESLFQWWDDFPDLQRGKTLVVFFLIIYNNREKKMKWLEQRLSWLRRAKLGPIQATRQYLAQLDWPSVVTLDELVSVSFEEFRAWARVPELDDYPKLRVLPLRKLINNRAEIFSTGGHEVDALSMEALHDKIWPYIRDMNKDLHEEML